MNKISYFEKTIVLITLGLTGAFCYRQVTNTGLAPKQSMSQIRKRLLTQNNVRMLYSTMTFSYLQAFRQGQVKDLFTLRDILKLSVPNIVILQLSEQQYQKKYLNVQANSRYMQVMKKVNELVSSSDQQQLLNMKEISMKNLQKFYMIQYCRKRKCKVINALKSKQLYQNLLKNNFEGQRLLSQIQAQDMVNRLIQQTKPIKYLGIIPKSPYNTILIISDPQLQPHIAKAMKERFKVTYGHNILQGDLLQREQLSKKIKENPYGFQPVK